LITMALAWHSFRTAPTFLQLKVPPLSKPAERLSRGAPAVNRCAADVPQNAEQSHGTICVWPDRRVQGKEHFWKISPYEVQSGNLVRTCQQSLYRSWTKQNSARVITWVITPMPSCMI